MCIALPGQVIAVNNTKATIDFRGNIIEVDARLVQTKVGDSVLVHAGCILEIISESDKDILNSILNEIEQSVRSGEKGVK